MLTARSDKKLIDAKALDEAIDRVIAGPQKHSRLMNEKEKKITAYHEGGHALVAAALPNTDPVHKITILPRGRALGYTMVLPDEDKYSTTRNEMLDQLAYMLGGRAAEEIVFHDPTTGASNDIEKATSVARAMVTQYGMTERIGAIKLGQEHAEPFLGRDMGHQRDYSEEVAGVIDEEVKKLIEAAHDEAWEILVDNRDVLDELVLAAARAGDVGQGRGRPHLRPDPQGAPASGVDRVRQAGPAGRPDHDAQGARLAQRAGQEAQPRRGRPDRRTGLPPALRRDPRPAARQRGLTRRGGAHSLRDTGRRCRRVTGRSTGRGRRQACTTRPPSAVRSTTSSSPSARTRPATGCVETPDRVARAYREIFAGLWLEPEDVLTTTFDLGHDEMVLVKDIEVRSMCEHHLVPFFGVAHVGYIPSHDGRITGLSKLARLVDVFARRPQVQERMTTQVADALMRILEPRGVIVVVECEHLCMSMRGIRKPGASTITSAVRGQLRDPATRAEAMSLIVAR